LIENILKREGNEECLGSWAAQGKENKEIKGAQDPCGIAFWLPYFLSLPALINRLEEKRK